ncbi:hypothetical protein HYFRA_00001238 [Hymenoscyphus fraxineus]|uniref:Uncharacterized protein n=1 Tax=Hymenoscyphus fraxineus TaxID=746836 RepID=A0A9N9PML5_9HELO|nr:hypothetical protein HYFRA_00001238 [Hymenoscyphus fraxineus]
MVTLRDGKRVGGDGTSSVEPQTKKVKATSSSTKASASAKPAVKTTNSTKKSKDLPKPKDEIKAEVKEAPSRPAAKSSSPKPEPIELSPNDTSNTKDEAAKPEESKPEASKPQTPTKTPPSPTPAAKPYEKTPGRVGPIREDDMSIKFDIKPFKGPKGKKVRKTAQEKDDEYGRLCLETPGHTFHELHVCYEKGPAGSPTYDKAGFELDYEKVANWMQPKPYNKQSMMRGMDKYCDRVDKEKNRMTELFWEPGAAPEGPCIDTNHWKDRVSKDLGIPYHKIGVPEFEKWDQMGFPKAKRGEYENPSEEERKRMSRLMSGSALRK